MARYPRWACWFATWLLGLVLAGCGGSSVDIEPNPVPPASMFVEHQSPFCKPGHQDIFSAGYYGSHPLDTAVHFYIVCGQGDTVFHDQWPSDWMVQDSTAQDSVQLSQLHQALRALVQGDLAANPDSLDRSAAGSQPIFSYRLGGHRDTTIYYSPERHRVMPL